MSGWRDRLAALTTETAGKCPDRELTELTKGAFGSFDSAQDEHFPLKQDAAHTVATMRAYLLKLAAEEGIPSGVVHRMTDADVASYAAVPDFTERNYRAHLRALAASADMDAGKVPAIWRGVQTAICGGCGPVLLELGAPDRVGNCPWCFRRRAGKAIPTPTGER
ncbi:MAG: hypothetical protein KGL91_07335 [Xanthomonadaceae bacterium]|nr:hypothetical protein [Xanthomonadaceae bacterium]